MTLEFTGHERDGFLKHEDWRDEDNGVRDYMRARYYSPADARFLSPDPAFDFDRLNPASFNLYAYARGNPIAFTDPTGTVPTTDFVQSKYFLVSGSATFKFWRFASEGEVVGLAGHDNDNGLFLGLLYAGGGEADHYLPTVLIGTEKLWYPFKDWKTEFETLMLFEKSIPLDPSKAIGPEFGAGAFISDHGVGTYLFGGGAASVKKGIFEGSVSLHFGAGLEFSKAPWQRLLMLLQETNSRMRPR